jgi:isopenicillin-N epimerase
MEALIRTPAANPKLWLLDDKVTFLNHGSFGACPRKVLEFQAGLRERLEREPIRFLVRELEPLLDQARKAVAQFVRADVDGLVFVANATTGINTVLRSLRFKADDELLVTNHEYNACRNALDFAAQRWGAKVVVARVPFPFKNEEEIIAALLKGITRRTRLLLVDHVTSQTGIVMPLARILKEARKRGVEVLVDGAHAPGTIPLNLKNLQPTYYTGNCHKWMCAPKTAAFLYVDKSRRPKIHPLSISHGANSRRRDRSRYLLEFGWTGTWDPTAMLSVPEAIRYMGSLLDGGWPEIMKRNRTLALAGRKILCEALEIELPCPPDYIGSLASIPLPRGSAAKKPKPPLFLDPLQDYLMRKRIEVPVVPWPAEPNRLMRISAQLYNSIPDYRRLADQLKKAVR